MVRPSIRGKFLYVGDQKLYVRGVTYGTFRLDENGTEIHDPAAVERDFTLMVSNGINAVRTYTVPPHWLLDAAQRHGLYVMVGLAWDQHVAFLDTESQARDIEGRVRDAVKTCAGHPAVLCYTVGNEIPSSIVRWHGARKIETFLKRLCDLVKVEDPEALVTYVNYPSTEYLELPFLDFLCFNVYLEAQDRLEAYLARLQNIADTRPLVLAEIGLDSERNGLALQANALSWQIRTAFAGGCSGVFVFAWTDEWYRGGFEILDWDFGITDRVRNGKPALEAVRAAFAEVPFPRALSWPAISVVVCSYNGSRTIADTCDGLRLLDYPDFEVIVVDDGSTDSTASIVRDHGFRVVQTENRGLSSARNTGLAAASGEIVAYTDDDARPDPEWLQYLAATFMSTEHVAVGGPGIAPPYGGLIADCVANAPGGPVHVLLSDREAEHIPGCNMAYRKSALEAVGAFDPRFRIAGDDVDMCWQLLDRGWTIGFNPAAVVWHHRRNSMRAYWRQQREYGKAESLLEQKWPEKYNSAGHVLWQGRLYGKGLTLPLPWRKSRIYHGLWGSAPFQSLYEPTTGVYGSLILMPEWYLLVAVLAGLSALGFLWLPFLLALPLLVLGLSACIFQAALGGLRASFPSPLSSRRVELQLRALTALLHLLQPLARLWGRLHSGLTPWRRRGHGVLVIPRRRDFSAWRQPVLTAEGWLMALDAGIRERGGVVHAGGDYDRWDLQVRGGMFGRTRLRMVIEEHGGGAQCIRFRVWPRISGFARFVLVTLSALALVPLLGRAYVVVAILGVVLLLAGIRAFWECSTSMATTVSLFEDRGMDMDVPFAFAEHRRQVMTPAASSSLSTPEGEMDAVSAQPSAVPE